MENFGLARIGCLSEAFVREASSTPKEGWGYFYIFDVSSFTEILIPKRELQATFESSDIPDLPT